MSAATALMTSPDFDWPDLTGRQQPHHLAVTAGDTALGDKALVLAGRLRTAAMPWQADVVRAIMARTPEGRWTHTDAVLICPRQNGKSLILSIIVLYRLFVMGETIIFTAQQWRTAEAIYKRTWTMARSSPSLRKLVVRTTCSQGRGTIELASGAEVTFTTRSTDAGRGLDDVDLLIYDEAYNLSDGEVAALGFTQLAAEDPQTIYTSSAVNQDQHAFGAELAALRERGLAGTDPQLYFAEFMAPADVECCEQCAAVGVLDREDPATWEYANPSYGVIQTEDKVRKMMRSMSTPEGRKAFDVEALGRGDWPVELAEDEVKPVIDLVEWAQLVDRVPAPTGVACLAIDVSAESDRAERTCSVVAAVETRAGRPHGQIGYHGPVRVAEVVAGVKAAVDAGDPVAVVIDPKSGAQVFIEPLRAAGIEPELVSFSGVQEATSGFLSAVDEGLLSHDGDQRMVDAIESAKLREFEAGGVAWARKKAAGKVCQLVAFTNAMWGLAKFKPGVVVPPPSVGHRPGAGVPAQMQTNVMEVAW